MHAPYGSLVQPLLADEYVLMQLLKLEGLMPILLAVVPNAVVFTMNPAVAYKDTLNLQDGLGCKA